MNPHDNILAIWNRNFGLDVTTEEVLESKFFLSDFSTKIEPLENGSAFSLACVRSKPFYGESNSETGWILWIGFDEESDARELLETQFKKFAELGVENVVFSGFTPDYFAPGIDKVRYPDVYQFLLKMGFKDRGEAIAMSSDLRKFREVPINESAGITIKTVDKTDRESLFDFLGNNFGGDWLHRAKSVCENGEMEQVHIAKLNGEIVGFSMFSGSEGKHWYLPGERFGPFGVLESMRGKGIGASLLNRTLMTMKGRGIRTAYFLWTDEKAKRLYSRFGFTEERRFTIMEREINRSMTHKPVKNLT